MVHFNNLSDVENDEILECFNDSFSDYSIPFRLNLAQLVTKIGTENVNKAISVGAFKDDRLVGFVLHGDRTDKHSRKAYNAGTGVRLDERGQKLTRRMYDYMIPILQQSHVTEVVLEVISDNVPAITSYEAIGFQKTRDLVCYSGELDTKALSNEVKIEEREVIDFSALAPFVDVRPSWQNTYDTILNLGKDALWLLAYRGEQLCGYAALNTTNNRVMQIAVSKEVRQQSIGSALLYYIKHNISNKISLINVDGSCKSVHDFLKYHNLEQTLVQHEMKLTI